MPSARVDLNQVFYSRNAKAQSRGRRLLYINKRKKYQRVSPMRYPGHEDVTSPRVCARKCSIEINGRRCKRRTCMDYRYCYVHLIAKKHLFIAPSRRLMSFGIPGKPLGLYAVASLKALRDAGKDSDGAPIETAQVVFKAGKIVGDYGGERLPDINARYDDPDNKETATYTVSLADGTVYDGIAAAGAISYSNELINVKKLMEDHGAKAEFIRAYGAEEARAKGHGGRANIDVADAQGPSVAFKATRDIAHGTEILWTYGQEYWSTSGMKRYLTKAGWDTIL